MKVSELIGAELDYWVAKAVGQQTICSSGYDRPHLNIAGNFATMYAVDWRGGMFRNLDIREYSPSTNWSQGGELIEKNWKDIHCWMCKFFGDNWQYCISDEGTELLTWFMRCIVTSKYGETVDV